MYTTVVDEHGADTVDTELRRLVRAAFVLVAPEDAIGQRRVTPDGAGVLDPAVVIGRVAAQGAVRQRRTAVEVVNSPADRGRVAAERAVDKRWSRILRVEHRAAELNRRVADEHAVDNGRTTRGRVGPALPVEHPATGIARKGTVVGVTTRDRESVKDRRLDSATARHDVIAVLAVVPTGVVVAIEVAAENGQMGSRVSLNEVRLAACKPAVDRHVVDELERSRPIPAGSCRCIRSFRNPDLNAASLGWDSRQRSLQVRKRVVPTRAVTCAGGIGVHQQRGNHGAYLKRCRRPERSRHVHARKLAVNDPCAGKLPKCGRNLQFGRPGTQSTKLQRGDQ